MPTLALGALGLFREQQHPSFPPLRPFLPFSPCQKAHPSRRSSCPTALPLQPHHTRIRGGCKDVVRGRAAGLSSSSLAATRGCFSPCPLHLAHSHSLRSLRPSPLSEQKVQSLLASSQLQNYPLQRLKPHSVFITDRTDPQLRLCPFSPGCSAPGRGKKHRRGPAERELPHTSLHQPSRCVWGAGLSLGEPFLTQPVVL